MESQRSAQDLHKPRTQDHLAASAFLTPQTGGRGGSRGGGHTSVATCPCRVASFGLHPPPGGLRAVSLVLDS